ncbi:hypothetical protein [Streptomyces carpaticus]|uniref:Uncharacterized protein n=1 Tax=Streptomyces carpaticus TaxID=285558 RepID=A0ABV4ZHB1_9ACTN
MTDIIGRGKAAPHLGQLDHPARPDLADSEFLRPEPARPGDGQQWVTGWCWLYCGHRFTKVLWLGVITAAGVSAPVYACGDCLARIHDAAWDYAEAVADEPLDRQGLPVPLYAPVGVERRKPVRFRRRHSKRPRTRLGELFHRAITVTGEAPEPPPATDPLGRNPRENTRTGRITTTTRRLTALR